MRLGGGKGERNRKVNQLYTDNKFERFAGIESRVDISGCYGSKSACRLERARELQAWHAHTVSLNGEKKTRDVTIVNQ